MVDEYKACGDTDCEEVWIVHSDENPEGPYGPHWRCTNIYPKPNLCRKCMILYGLIW